MLNSAARRVNCPGYFCLPALQTARLRTKPTCHLAHFPPREGDPNRGITVNDHLGTETLPFYELQQKILPELHLIAAQAGIENYRKLKKDALALAIMERQAEREGQTLARGFLEISPDGYGFLQGDLLDPSSRTVLITAGIIKQFFLRSGDEVIGRARRPRENERYGSLIQVEAVNGLSPEAARLRPRFDDLTPTFPDQQLVLEEPGVADGVSLRVVDLLVPIGRGQRALIVAPPKAGKTTLLKKIANSITRNYPDVTVIVLLVDERPEEVTDFRESVQGAQVIASTFDEPPQHHVRVAEFVHERARRLVEDGGHVVILLDSITRLARANNLVTPPTGRTLSGGLDSNALHWPKRFLGAARNIREGGSLTILATALVETGSRMDDVIFEEFKGTGNAELVLSRRLEERRIFPAMDITKSSDPPRRTAARPGGAQQDVAAAQGHLRHGPGRRHGNAARQNGQDPQQPGVPGGPGRRLKPG